MARGIPKDLTLGKGWLPAFAILFPRINRKMGPPQDDSLCLRLAGKTGSMARMRRKLRLENFGAVDPVLSRGGRREEFFPADVDRLDFARPPGVIGGLMIAPRSQAISRSGEQGLARPKNEPSCG